MDSNIILEGLKKEETIRYFLSRAQGMPIQKSLKIKMNDVYSGILLFLYTAEVNQNPCPIGQLNWAICQWLYFECVNTEKYYNRFVIYVNSSEADLILERLHAAEYIETERTDVIDQSGSMTVVRLLDKGKEVCKTLLLDHGDGSAVES